MKYARLGITLSAWLALVVPVASAQTAGPAAAPAGPAAAPAGPAPAAPGAPGAQAAPLAPGTPAQGVPTNVPGQASLPQAGASAGSLPQGAAPQPGMAPQPSLPGQFGAQQPGGSQASSLNFDAQQGSLGQRNAATTSTGAANAARDNAQLGSSLTARNLERTGGQGASRDNAVTAAARQNARFAGAADSAAPEQARAGVASGQSEGSPGAQNPANTGPVPGTDVFTGPDGETYVVTTRNQPAPVIAGGVSGAPGPGREPAAETVETRTTTSPTRVNTSTPIPNKRASEGQVYGYGPKGGDNTVGVARLAELEGNFRYSRPKEAARKKRTRVTASADQPKR